MFAMGERTLNRKLLTERLDRMGARALEKWAVNSDLSASLLGRIKRNGYIPPKDVTRIKAASALGLGEDDLFPRSGSRRTA